MSVQSILIDYDGVIIDSESVNLEAWRLAFHHAGYTSNSRIELTEVDIAGVPLQGIFCIFEQVYMTTFSKKDRQELLNSKNRIYYALAPEKLKLKKGSKEFLQRFHGTRQLVLVTNSVREKAMFSLKLFEIEHYFDRCFFGDSFEQKNYANLAKVLEISKNRAAVIEDTAPLVAQAKEMDFALIIGVEGIYTASELYHAGASLVIQTFDDEKLTELFN